MRNLLTKHGIPTGTLSEAVAFLNDADAGTISAFNGEFKLTMNGADALSAAKFAADAIFRGADAVDKVVGYVAKRMTGVTEKPAAQPLRVVMVGVPVVDTPAVSIVPVVVMGEAEARKEVAPNVVVKGRRGRRRLGNSDMCTAVKAIEAAGNVERQTLLDCIMAQRSANGGNIKPSSAAVYLWRYNKGERE